MSNLTTVTAAQAAFDLLRTELRTLAQFDSPESERNAVLAFLTAVAPHRQSAPGFVFHDPARTGAGRQLADAIRTTAFGSPRAVELGGYARDDVQNRFAIARTASLEMPVRVNATLDPANKGRSESQVLMGWLTPTPKSPRVYRERGTRDYVEAQPTAFTSIVALGDVTLSDDMKRRTRRIGIVGQGNAGPRASRDALRVAALTVLRREERVATKGVYYARGAAAVESKLDGLQ